MNSSKPYAIVHFQALENYPPVMNMINLLDKRDVPLRVFTQRSENKEFRFTPSPQIKVSRFTVLNKAVKPLRMLSYLNFIIASFLYLLILRPKRILYYESISAIPVILFSRIFPRTKTFVHYHEYISPEEYQNGMIFNKISFGMEKKLFPKYAWISHTNELRLKRFEQKFDLLPDLNYRVMANYPSKQWKSSNPKKPRTNEPVRLVYVGAVSLESMYLPEVCEWVSKKNGDFTLDIYSQQKNIDFEKFLHELKSEYVNFRGPVNYFNQPDMLVNYDVGLILYKGLIDNYIYNAPNKYYEYYNNGLDTWFPTEMIGMKSYIDNEALPKTIEVNFQDLDSYDFEDLISMPEDSPGEKKYYCEEEYSEFLDNFLLYR